MTCVAVLWAVAFAMRPIPAGATGRDFLDETVLSRGFEAQELGFELGLESRLDIDYRVQGWYTTEIEFAPTSRLLLECVGQLADRGRGLDTGGWRAGMRYRLGRPWRSPVDVSAAVEFEYEPADAKRPSIERILVPRFVVSRVFADLVTMTANVGPAHRFGSFSDTRWAYSFGVRVPEGRPLEVGFEYVHEPLERSTRLAPQIWLMFPYHLRMRLGGVFGTEARPYWFTGRAIVEVEF